MDAVEAQQADSAGTTAQAVEAVEVKVAATLKTREGDGNPTTLS